MIPRQYDFGERLAMSHGVSVGATVGEILVAQIPGARSAIPANELADRNGTDWWVTMSNGHQLSVDCKVREEDWWKKRGEDDLALEHWSVVERSIPGWTLRTDKRTDYVLWLWKDTGRWCLVPFAMLGSVFRDKWKAWTLRYRTARQHTPNGNGGYHSECVFVPRREVWSEIYKRFAGQPVAAIPAVADVEPFRETLF